MSDIVFVTGGSGFVGTAIVTQLLQDLVKKPWKRVVCLVRNEKAAAKVKALGAEPVYGSLTDESSARWKQVASVAGYVIHSAQPVFTSKNYQQERTAMEKNLLSALGPNIKRAVFCYGSAYYGMSAEQVDETMDPRNPIGAGNFFEEPFRLVQQSNVNYAAAFVGGVYGIGSWFTEMYLHALQNNDPIYTVDPAPVWPYIHIEDVARALEFLLTVPTERLEQEGRQFILADDKPIRTTEFVQKLADHACADVKPNIQVVDRATLDTKLGPAVGQYFGSPMNHSNQRIRKLGFQLKYPTVDAGLKNSFVVSPP